MAILKNRTKLQLSVYNYLKPTWPKIRIVALGFGILVATVLMNNTNNKHTFSQNLLEVSGIGASKAINIYSLAAGAYSGFRSKLAHLQNLEAEVIGLKLELTRMRRSQKQLEQLSLENSELKKLLNYSERMTGYARSARLLTVSTTAFGNTAIIDSGSNEGITEDQIVTSCDSIFGRVVEVSPNYSRVMLATDFNSRIPVITSISHERGMLVGDNVSAKVLYIQNPAKIIIGEAIVTSGDGKVYPVGINISDVKAVVNDVVLIEPMDLVLDSQFVAVHKKIKLNINIWIYQA